MQGLRCIPLLLVDHLIPDQEMRFLPFMSLLVDIGMQPLV
jgi:hypothetical protein